MLHKVEYRYDVATALSLGRRELQEDAVDKHFPLGTGCGWVVLADGMGGHAAGEVASRIAVDEVFAEITRHADDPSELEGAVGSVLHSAVDRANDMVARLASNRADLQGMGTTLVAYVVVSDRLYWISVGDSPLFLLRGQRMVRLNREHSLASRFEAMVSRGELTREEAESDPDRACLTSALSGVEIPEIDCRDRPLDLEDGDIVVAASDGILYLDEAQIATLIYDNRARSSEEIGRRLLGRIEEIDHPDQDNVSVCVLKIAKGAFADAVPVPAPGAQGAGYVQGVYEDVVRAAGDPESKPAPEPEPVRGVAEKAAEEVGSEAAPAKAISGEITPPEHAAPRTVMPTRATVILQARRQGRRLDYSLASVREG